MTRCRSRGGASAAAVPGATALCGAVLTAIALSAGCAGTSPQHADEDCPTWEGLAPVRVNPAGAPDRHLRLQAAFRVCPPETGATEIERKRIELRHEVISLLSGQTEAQLRDPLRAEKLRTELMRRANDRVLRRSRVVDVYITAMELE